MELYNCRLNPFCFFYSTTLLRREPLRVAGENGDELNVFNVEEETDHALQAKASAAVRERAVAEGIDVRRDAGRGGVRSGVLLALEADVAPLLQQLVIVHALYIYVCMCLYIWYGTGERRGYIDKHGTWEMRDSNSETKIAT